MQHDQNRAFGGIDKLIWNLYGKAKDLEQFKIILQHNQIRGLTPLDFNTFKVMSKTLCQWYYIADGIE